MTDCGFCRCTAVGALQVAWEADRLYCEATYPDRLAAKAAVVCHLTGGQAGTLARAAGARELIPFHFSRRWGNDPQPILADLERGFSSPGPFDAALAGWLAEQPSPPPGNLAMQTDSG